MVQLLEEVMMSEDKMFESLMSENSHNLNRNPNGCKDGGTCHHDCSAGCFREKYCVPFPDSGLDDNWELTVGE